MNKITKKLYVAGSIPSPGTFAPHPALHPYRCYMTLHKGLCDGIVC